MSEVEEFRLRSEECLRRYGSAGQLSKSFWLGLSKQWASMADEAQLERPTISSAHFGKLKDVLEEALSAKALALSAARIAESDSGRCA